MGKVKDPPCPTCPLFIKCEIYFIKRKEEYDDERDSCEDYNSESLYDLGKRCALLKNYLFLDEVSFPGRNMHFSWWPEMENKISQLAWIKRWNLILDIWDHVFEPNSM